MKLEVKYLFPTFILISCLQVNEKNISKWYQNAKESTNQGGHFLDFHGFSWSCVGPKSNLHLRREISSMASLALKSSINALNDSIIQFLWQFKSFGYPLLTRQNLILKSCSGYLSICKVLFKRKQSQRQVETSFFFSLNQNKFGVYVSKVVYYNTIKPWGKGTCLCYTPTFRVSRYYPTWLYTIAGISTPLFKQVFRQVLLHMYDQTQIPSLTS